MLQVLSFGCTKNLDELAATLLCGEGLNAFNGPKGIQRVNEIYLLALILSIKSYIYIYQVLSRVSPSPGRGSPFGLFLDVPSMGHPCIRASMHSIHAD